MSLDLVIDKILPKAERGHEVNSVAEGQFNEAFSAVEDETDFLGI